MCEPCGDDGHVAGPSEELARVVELLPFRDALRAPVAVGTHVFEVFATRDAFEVVTLERVRAPVWPGMKRQRVVTMRIVRRSEALPAWAHRVFERLVAVEMEPRIAHRSLFDAGMSLTGFAVRPERVGTLETQRYVGLSEGELGDADAALSALGSLTTDPERETLAMDAGPFPAPWRPPAETRFWSFDQALALVARLACYAAASPSRPLRQSLPAPSVSFPLGHALEHCAQTVERAVTGFPRMKSALFRSTVGRLALRKFLGDGRMSHDRDAAVPGMDALSCGAADGAARLRAAIAAFRAHGGELAPHFAYGAVHRRDYEAVLTMHIADHAMPFLSKPSLCTA